MTLAGNSALTYDIRRRSSPKQVTCYVMEKSYIAFTIVLSPAAATEKQRLDIVLLCTVK